jgi:hypothetical protein
MPEMYADHRLREFEREESLLFINGPITIWLIHIHKLHLFLIWSETSRLLAVQEALTLDWPHTEPVTA